MTKFISYLILFCLSLAFIACNDDDSSSNSYPYSIRLTDAPGPYEHVYIDIQGIEIKGNDGSTVSVSTNTGIYDLLELSSGIETVLSNDTLTSSRVNQIRFILGTQNSIVKDGVTYDLDTPSAMQSGLKIQVHQDLEPNSQNSILLDFDATKSIVVNGNGTYSLKPVIRAIDLANTGAIEGMLSLPGTVASIEVLSDSGETYYTNALASGYFKRLGLPAGNYTVTITPEDPYAPVIVTDVSVTIGQTTDIGTITIQ